MPTQGRHILARIMWPLGSFFAWAAICRASVLVLDYLVNVRKVRPAEPLIVAYGVVAIGGVLVIPPVVAVLAMRSKLPWTGPGRPGPQGFPVQVRPAP